MTAHRSRPVRFVLLPLLALLLLPAISIPLRAADPLAATPVAMPAAMPTASPTAAAMPATPTPAPGAYSTAIWHSADVNHLKYGIAGHAWWLDSHLDEFMAYYHQLGITNVRLSIDWKRFEPQPGQYDFTLYDRVLNRLAAENIEVIGSFVSPPAWASPDPTKCAQAQQTFDQERHACGINPAYDAQFREAVRVIAARYPFIRLWEFWNEPELWDQMGHEVGDYLRWLKPFYEEMHAVNPGAVVAANTLAGVYYVDWLYNSSDSANGPAKRPWDAISFHPYGALKAPIDQDQTASFLATAVGDVHKRMVDAGDTNKRIWITEYGWETDPDSQARYLTQGFAWLLAQDYVEVANLHMLHDWTGEHFGLLTTVPPIYHTGNDITPQTRFVPKEPYFSTFKNLAKPIAAIPPPSGPGTLVFAQTGHAIQGEFRTAWEAAGGIATLGLPRTGEYPRRDAVSGQYFRAQDFERGRLIVRVAANGQLAHVDLDTITDATLSTRGLFDPASAASVDIAPPFRDTWQTMGGIAFLGPARTGLMMESGVPVQYFARGRLEQRGGSVTLGLVGDEALVAKGWLDAAGNDVPGTPAAREWMG